VHDDGPHIQWRLAVVEDLIHGGDVLVRAANIRTSTGWTNRPIVQLIPLEISTRDNKDSACSGNNGLSKSVISTRDSHPREVIESYPTRNSARRLEKG